MNSPESIVKERLKPTEYRMVLTGSKLCSLRMRSRRKPGMKVRNKNPVNALRIGISSPMESKATRPKRDSKNAKARIRIFLIDQLVILRKCFCFLCTGSP